MTVPAPMPAWKFWHPLPFWKAFVAFLVANLLVTFAWVLLRHGLGITFIPEWTIGGAGGLLGLLFVSLWKRRAA